MSFFLVIFIILLLVALPWRTLKEGCVMFIRSYFAMRKIPGPAKEYWFIGVLWELKWNMSELFVQVMEWCYKYIFENKKRNGLGMAWLGPVPLVFIVQAEHIKVIMDSTTLLDKSSFYSKLVEWLGPDGLLLSSGERWHTRRRMLTPAFHFNILKTFHEVFYRQGEIFLEQLLIRSDTGREIDIFPYIQRCALDIICETSMGTQMHTQTGHNTEYVDAVSKITKYAFHYIRYPWLWFKPIWYATGYGLEFDRCVKLATDFTRKIIAERRLTLKEDEAVSDRNENEIPDKYRPFIDILLMKEKSYNLSEEDIRQEVDTFMFGGHDTVSVALGYSIWLIGQYPECQTKLHAELDMIFEDSMREQTNDDIKQMIYLEKCIKESLRMCPPAPLFGRTLCHDVVLGDVTIPKGVTVVLSPFGCHRDPLQWERPEEFYPEHFDQEAVLKRHPFAFCPFSGGPRSCIGQKFAMIEMRILLSQFFRQFTVETVEPLPGNRFSPEIMLKPESGFLVRLYRRK